MLMRIDRWMTCRMTALALAAVLILSAGVMLLPAAASAAKIEVTASVKAQFDRTAAAAQPAMRSRLQSQYGKLLTARNQRESWELAVKQSRYLNDEQEAAIRRSLRDLDADKIKSLERQVEQAKLHAKPASEMYTAAKRLASAAKSSGQKTLYTYYRNRADTLKLAADLARDEVKRKEEALRTAKRARTDRAKQIRAVLAEREKLNARIKAERAALTVPNRRIGEVWKNFKTAVKAEDSARTASALTQLIADHETIVAVNKRIHAHERSAAEVINRARRMLAQ